jgi:hypothetical protein
MLKRGVGVLGLNRIRFGGPSERCGGKAGICLVVEEENGSEPEMDY